MNSMELNISKDEIKDLEIKITSGEFVASVDYYANTKEKKEFMIEILKNSNFEIKDKDFLEQNEKNIIEEGNTVELNIIPINFKYYLIKKKVFTKSDESSIYGYYLAIVLDEEKNVYLKRCKSKNEVEESLSKILDLMYEIVFVFTDDSELIVTVDIDDTIIDIDEYDANLRDSIAEKFKNTIEEQLPTERKTLFDLVDFFSTCLDYHKLKVLAK